jgi:hypothetical protein
MIPKLNRVTSVTDDEMYASACRSFAHSASVTLDSLVGLIGGHVPYITISARCALAILNAQEKGTAIPFWAKVLGNMLETKWAIPFISYPGHLQDAMIGDYGRCKYVMRQISGS